MPTHVKDQTAWEVQMHASTTHVIDKCICANQAGTGMTLKEIR
ncbi:4778_t:CDS:1, partial [Cetraspora pellucida]